ncbi:MAG TPA: hypothetical protein GXX37_11160 [Clostridiaceae bacterium]|nr:hypothetical protein [Clostridiaceae bacterium]
MNMKFAIVKSRINMELNNIDKLHSELQARGLLEQLPSRVSSLSDQFQLRAVGSILHDFYTCAENIFKIIARYIDESTPDGSDWHLELLQQMSTDIANIRPYVISSQTLQYLNEYKGFRHIFRNIYGFNLIAERIERLLDLFDPTIKLLKQDIQSFIQKMDEAISS